MGISVGHLYRGLIAMYWGLTMKEINWSRIITDSSGKPIGVREFARRKRALKKEGLYGARSTAPTRVILTAGEVSAANGDPIGLVEMARRKAALTKSGSYDRSYTDQ